MGKIAAFAFATVLTISSIMASAWPDYAFTAFAATPTGSSTVISSPYAHPYIYYSDLFFKEGGSATLAVGKMKKLNLMHSGAINWTSSDPRIASVNQTGIVSARRAGVTRIMARSVNSGRSVVCTVKVYKKRTQAQARKAILALKKAYYPGRRWTNSNYYYWQAANCHCYGCIAFAGIASDKAFGKFAPLKRHGTFSKIKVGDHVRIGENHSVVVLSKQKKSIIVAEGNYNCTFNWGRTIPYAELKQQGFYVETRY